MSTDQFSISSNDEDMCMKNYIRVVVFIFTYLISSMSSKLDGDEMIILPYGYISTGTVFIDVEWTNR